MTNIIAIVGKSGSGKTTFSNLLTKYLDCQKISVDEIAHSIYDNQEFIDFINDVFGSNYIDDNGRIVDRKIIGEYVFSHRGSKEVKMFNEISWRLMKEKIDSILTNTKSKCVILEWFNLHNTCYFDMATVKILIKAKDEEQRTMMIRLRDNISKEYLDKRENTGISYNECDFDYVVEIEYDNEDIITKAETIANAINNKCKCTNCEIIRQKD